MRPWEHFLASFPDNHSLSESVAAYECGDMAFFASSLPTAEQYRVALGFPRNVLFLDIETTGLSIHYDRITIAGWSFGSDYGVYIAGQEENAFWSALSRAKVLVTFDGTLFDLKFLKKQFNAISIPSLHIDLRFFAKRVGLTGGQKAIEKEIGYARSSDVAGLLVEAAPLLWHQYRRGDLAALRRLIDHNHVGY